MGDIRRVMRRGKFVGWYVRYLDVDGKRKMRASHQPSKAEARRYLLEVEARVARGLVGIPEAAPVVEGTVADLCARFLREFSSLKIKDLSAYKAGASTELRRLLPWLGEKHLHQLTRHDIEQALRAAQEKYRPNTVRTSTAKLQAVFSWAMRRGIIQSDPVKGIGKPAREDSLEHLTVEESKRLLAELERRSKGKRSALVWKARFVAVSLALHLGLRRGEIFGLRWCDVGEGRLTVARSYRGLPKSNKSRHLPLPPDLDERLREWRNCCPSTEEGLVCPVLYGGTWHMSTKRATHGLAAALKAAGCRSLTRGFHALRHTMASAFVEAGGSIVALQKILGHTSIAQTQIYAHVSPDYLAQELSRVRY